MAAKPRLTVRLAPSYLHALAYIAARDNLAPAEAARMLLQAQLDATLTARGWREDQQDAWRAWLAEQGAKGGRVESPEQADYDRLAAGLPPMGAPPAGPPAHEAMARHRPLAATIAAGEAHIDRVRARLAGQKGRG